VPVVVSTSGESFLYLAPGEWINWPFSANLARAGEDAIWRSGWVVGTIDDGEVSDLRLSVARYQGPGVGLLSVLTAYFIPGVVDIRIDVAVKLSRSAHGTRECSRSHELRVWYQTLLIFVYPFRSPTRGEIASVQALTLECLAEILERPTHYTPHNNTLQTYEIMMSRVRESAAHILRFLPTKAAGGSRDLATISDTLVETF